MEQQLDELKAKVESSQQALVEYERQHQIVNTSEKGSVQEQILSDLSRDLTTAESDRLQKEALYRQVQSNRKQLAILVHNDLLQKLEEKSADLQDQYTDAVAQYGPKFPKALRLQEEIEGINTQIATEQDRVLATHPQRLHVGGDAREAGRSGGGCTKGSSGSTEPAAGSAQYPAARVRRQSAALSSLMQRLKDATVSAGLQSTNIHLVDAALAPVEPVRPRRRSTSALDSWRVWCWE